MKEIIDNLDFIKVKNFCSVKDNVKENENTSHWLGENTCKKQYDRGLLTKIYEELLKLNNK